MPLRLIAILLAIFAIVGCGSRQYEERFAASTKKLRQEMPFRSLWPEPIGIPLSIDGENVLLEVRIPRIFDTNTKEAYALDEDTKICSLDQVIPEEYRKALDERM